MLWSLRFRAEHCRLDDFIDEYNHAQGLIRVPADHRDIGDLNGALLLAKEAERYAQEARYSAPSIWCQLAEFYLSLPLRDEAVRCVEKGQEVMPLAVGDDEAVLPGDESGRWIPGFSIEDYQQEIDQARARARLAGTPLTPRFDPASAAQLLSPDDEQLRLQLRQAIERGLALINGRSF
jgi:hypothetical protein